MRARASLSLPLVAITLGGCIVVPRSAPTQLEPASVLPTAPPPRPQVVLSDPNASAASAPAYSQVVAASAPASPMTEAERRRVLIDPTPPAPWPPPSPAVTREVIVRDVPAYYRTWSPGCEPGCYGPSPWALPEIAAYGVTGAIIGHQFHERGRGAAIGLALGLLAAPWCWWGGRRCWDD